MFDTDPELYVSAEFNKGVLHALDVLASRIGNPDYVAGDGSEDYDTDLGDTFMNLLAAAGLYDHDNARLAALPGSPEQRDFLRNLVDWVHLHATEGDSWPSTKTADDLIERASVKATQADADAYQAYAARGRGRP